MMKQTNKLIHELDTAEIHTGELESYVKTVRTNLDDLHDDLDVSRKVNQSLRELDSSLSTAESLLKTVSIIPQIRNSAGRLRTTISGFRSPITKALKASDRIEQVVKPIRESIEKVEPRLEVLDKALLVTLNVENESEEAFCSASSCINSLPNSEIKTELSNQLETTASSISPVVLEFDKNQLLILSQIENAKNYSDQIRRWFTKLNTLQIEIKSFIYLLRPLIKALKAIKNVFKEVIRVPFGGYPRFCQKKVAFIPIEYPCGWTTVYFSFSIEQILNGVTGPVKPVLDLLNSAMNAILNPLLDALNLDMKLPSIPGLDILNEVEDQLEKVYNELSNELNQVLNALDDYNKFIAQLKKKIAEALSINTNCITNSED